MRKQQFHCLLPLLLASLVLAECRQDDKDIFRAGRCTMRKRRQIEALTTIVARKVLASRPISLADFLAIWATCHSLACYARRRACRLPGHAFANTQVFRHTAVITTHRPSPPHTRRQSRQATARQVAATISLGGAGGAHFLGHAGEGRYFMKISRDEFLS